MLKVFLQQGIKVFVCMTLSGEVSFDLIVKCFSRLAKRIVQNRNKAVPHKDDYHLIEHVNQ